MLSYKNISSIRKLCFAGLLICAGYLLHAEEIASVKFEQGKDFQFEEDVLRANVQSRKGGRYTERSVNDDIKRLHAMGVFSDVVAVTKKRDNGKIDIIFQVKSKPIVKEIKFVGNRKYTTKKLQEQIKIYPNSPLNELQLRNSADALRKFYKSKGLNDAVIEPVGERINDKYIRIVFKIKENLRLRVGEIKIETPQGKLKVYKLGELKEKLYNRKSIFSHPWFSWFMDYGLLDRAELKRDEIRLRDEYWKKGYLDFRVKKVVLQENPKNPEIMNITFIVDEGEPYKVDKITFNGMKRFKKEELTKLSALKQGQNFSSTAERATMDSVDQKYSRLGYADFVINAQRYPNFKTHKVDVTFTLREGQPYRIHDIFISGNKYTKDYVILRELPISPGDPVDKSMVKLTQSRLMGMGYFNKVEAVSINSENGPSDTKDIDIHVDEKKFIDARIGATWSDTDSLAGMIEVSHKNMDILDPWNYFTGGGQRMRLMGLIGIERYNVQLDFTEPWLFGIPLRWDVSGYFRNISYDDQWDERRLGVTTSLTKRIFDDFTNVQIGYTFEQVKIHNMDKDLSYRFQEQEGSELVGRVHLSLGRDTRNDAMNPTRGYMVNGLAALTTQALGASNNYLRLELKGTYHYSFFNDWLVASVGGKIGFLTDFTSDSEVPLFERYFLGGGESVRGFPYRSIGPTDHNDDNYGGQTMYIITAELSHPIYKMIRGAAFIDIGDASEDSFQFSEVNIGVGYGLRIKLPNVNAPVRLDLAYPVLNDVDGVKNTLRFHFNIGASFGPR